MPSLPHQNQGSQQLPVTELYQIIHQGPQVDTPARAPVASDLQRSYDITLSQSVNNLPDAIHSNPPRQMISSNVQDDANALDNSHNLQNDAKDLEPSNLQTQDKINLPKYLYPVMNVTDFKNRYEADGIHLARAATRQDRNVKVWLLISCSEPVPQCTHCQKARKFSFCVLDYTSPACKCLRCIKNCLTPCTNENKMLQDCKPNLTRFPRIQNQREVKEEEDQDENDYDDLEEYEAGPVFSECRSTMAPRPSAKKRKHNQTSDHEDQGLKHPMTRARTKAKSSTPKANAKMPRNLTPEPSNSLAAPQIPVHNSDFRMGKYFWFREGVSPQINSILEDMCRGMQEIAHIEYHRGRRDERGAWENGERDIGMDAQSSNKTSRARDDSEEDAEGDRKYS